MGRRKQQKSLAIWMNQVYVGEWRVNAQGVHSLHYDNNWLSSDAYRPLSLSLAPAGNMPDSPVTGPVVEHYFDNLLPDNSDIRRRVQENFGTATSHAFDLLAQIGRDCVGAVQLLPVGQTPGETGITGTALNEQAIAELIRQTPRSAGGLAGRSQDFRISLAGAQEKLALLLHDEQWLLPSGSTPTSHIIKLPLGRIGREDIDMALSVYNEWLCGEILRAFELPVAKSKIMTFANETVLVVKRFDRRWFNNQLLRLPQEDMCQALGRPGGQKYESDGGPGMAEIMALLQNSQTPLDDRYQFFKSQILFYLLGAVDGHARNFSIFLHRQGRFQLTPLYDVMSVFPVTGKKAGQIAPQKAKMAMGLHGSNRHYHLHEMLPRHWEATANRCGFAQLLPELMQEIIQTAPAAFKAAEAIVPRGFPSEVSETIFEGCRRQLRRLR